MLASCFKKQMQLEFMFSSLSEKRNQNKLPSKSCVVIQIPPTKICNRKQEPGNRRAEIHKAAVAPLAWGWQLADWRPLLCSPLSLRTVTIITCRRVRNEVFGDGRQVFLERVGRAGISDSAISSGNASPAGKRRLNSSLTLRVVSWLSRQWRKHKVNAKQQGSFIF